MCCLSHDETGRQHYQYIDKRNTFHSYGRVINECKDTKKRNNNKFLLSFFYFSFCLNLKKKRLPVFTHGQPL